MNFGVFALVFLLMCFMLDFFISGSLKKMPGLAKGEYGIWDDIYNGKINSDVVIYGSSRAWVHIDPQLISKAFGLSCYNLGMDGEKFPLQYFRHKELLRFNKRPKIIIQSLDIFSFVKDSGLYNYQQFLPYMLFNKQIFDATNSYKGFKPIDFLFPCARYIGKRDLLSFVFDERKAKPFETNRIKGYRANNLSWNNDLENAKKTMGHYKIIIDNSIVNKFGDYLQQCKAMKIKVILVYTPEYIEGQRFVVNRDEIMQLYHNISNKFHVPLYDYSTDSICYQRQYFYNSSHMNKTGSLLFTKLFIEDLKRDKQIEVFSKNVKSSSDNRSIEKNLIN